MTRFRVFRSSNTGNRKFTESKARGDNVKMSERTDVLKENILLLHKCMVQALSYHGTIIKEIRALRIGNWEKKLFYKCYRYW